MTAPPQPPREPGGPPPDSNADPAAPPAERARKFALQYAKYEAADRKRAAECVAGAVLSCGAVLGSVLGFMCMGGGRALAFPLLVIALLVTTALKMRENPDRRGLAAGIWIGIGIALLLEGMCWLVILRSRIGG